MSRKSVTRMAAVLIVAILLLALLAACTLYFFASQEIGSGPFEAASTPEVPVVPSGSQDSSFPGGVDSDDDHEINHDVDEPEPTIDEAPVGFAATDAEIESIISEIADGPINSSKRDLFLTWSIPEDRLRNHRSGFGGRLNWESWQVSESYWITLSHDYASPDRLSVCFQRERPCYP